MENKFTFNDGIYFVGDPGFALPYDDLRNLFDEIMRGELKPGKKELVSSYKLTNSEFKGSHYWVVPTPHKRGTIYDQNSNGWGFDWGCFGVIPWEWIETKGCYDNNKIEFTEPFECFTTENKITIGHLHFNLLSL
jgi:hypothetical protein